MSLNLLRLQTKNLFFLKQIEMSLSLKHFKIFGLPISLLDTSFEAILLIEINEVPLNISTTAPTKNW